MNFCPILSQNVANLRDKDNLQIKDKTPVPKVSFVHAEAQPYRIVILSIIAISHI